MGSFTNKLENAISIISPKWALQRKYAKFAYEAIDGGRTRRKRNYTPGTGDRHLTDYNLARLREIARDMSRNNPLAKGLLRTEMLGVVGDGVKIQARTTDESWNNAAEDLWREEMVKNPCDITGRFNFDKLLKTAYLSYRRDGDFFIITHNDSLEAVEGDNVGTPQGKYGENYIISNGVAYSKNTGRVIGYYIGQASDYGYIKPDTYRRHLAADVFHMFDPERVTFSRGEPALTSAIDFIDKLCEYVDAELVAAKVNACFTMFVSQKDEFAPDGYTAGISSDGTDPATYSRLEKVEPGTIMYGSPGEDAKGIGNTRPGSLFDPFVLRMLTFIGRPLCMPLMLVTQDFSGATFMNARIAYQKAQEQWKDQQANIIMPFVERVWRWKIDGWIAKSLLTDRDDKYRNDILCARWPYVDPYKEAIADKQQLENKTITRAIICSRQGEDFSEIANQLRQEEEILKVAGLIPTANNSESEINNGQ